jgi:CRISPR system Cascade subunit CasC
MMSRFVQLHLLTSYPPANLNRDDLGRPKTAIMGGETRLRVSSQSLKRAWRTSEVFKTALEGHIGIRTKMKGVEIFQALLQGGMTKKQAKEWAKEIAGQFGKLKTLSKKEKEGLKKLDDDERLKKELTELEIEQLAHFSPEEGRAIDQLVATLIERKSGPEKDELAILRKHHAGADIALFGRMLASSPAYNTEAAAQVAHAFSVHRVIVEDDFFTAVDDLNTGEEDMGAGHMGDTEFAAGLFYLYLCVDKNLLVENLSGDEDLANKTLAALIECAATVAPTGKQNSFASRARASYMLCETGDQQPRSLSVSFLKSVPPGDMLQTAILRIEQQRTNMDKVYGRCAGNFETMNAVTGEGSLQKIIQCAQEADR